MVPLIGRDTALLWPKNLNIISQQYHGEVFEGNACRTLLREADRLNNPVFYENVGLFKLMPFISAFKAMDKVVTSSFSTKKVAPDLEKNVEILRKAFLATQVSETLKIHVATKHLNDCLQYLSGNGLGIWSEQAGESVHKEFIKYWNRYKMNNIHDAKYGQQLKKAVVEFSSLHI